MLKALETIIRDRCCLASAVGLARVWRGLALVGLSVVALGACGTSTVSMMVVRPSPINAQTYGGTVSVAGFSPAYPDYAVVAGQLKQEVAERVANNVGGVVRLLDYGGGLVISGQVEEYATYLKEGMRQAECIDKVTTSDGPDAATKLASRPCRWRWFDWTARAVVTTRVTTAAGQPLLIQPMTAERTGRTGEVRDVAPPPPNAHQLLQELRHELAQQIANLVVPHLQRVDAIVYDCAEPATKACEAGTQYFAASKYDPAVSAYTQALALLDKDGASSKERAKVLWNRGLVFEFSRRFDEAIADFRVANQLDPQDAYRDQQAAVEHERDLHYKLLQEGLGPQPTPPK